MSAYFIIDRDHPFYARGVNSGAANAVIGLARAIAKMGRRVVVAAQLADGECTERGVEYWDLGASYDVARALERAGVLGPFHLIVSCRALPLVLSQGNPLCLSRTFMAHDPSGSATGLKAQILCSLADSVYCVSEAQKDLFVRDGAPAERVTVLPNGVDLEVFTPRKTKATTARKLVFAGALVMDKGIDILIESYARLASEFPDLTLDVFGSASLWGREEFFEQEEISRQLPGITFHGNVPSHRIAQAYQEATVCVIPSRWFDSFPLTALEAQASGCPVVAFPVGGIPEAVEDGVTGILAPEISVEALTLTLEQILRDPSRVQMMSEACVSRTRAKYSWEKVARVIIERNEVDLNPSRIGIITTWKQECGLAKVAEYLSSEFPENSYHILAERVPGNLAEKNVTYCWHRTSGDYGEIEQVVRTHNLSAVLINMQAPSAFFQVKQFFAALQRLRDEGRIIILYLHSTFGLDGNLQQLLEVAHQVIVHSPQNRLDIIANGGVAENITVIPHGIALLPPIEREQYAAIRSSVGVKPNEKLLFTFGFLQPHKGMEGLLEAVAHLLKKGIPCRGVIAGSIQKSDPNSESYARALKKLVQELNIAEFVTFLDYFVSDEQIDDYLRASDLTILNYHTRHFESSGVACRSLGAGTPTLLSLAPSFSVFENAAWRITSGFPIGIAAELILSRAEVRKELKQHAARICEEFSWAKTASRFQAVFAKERITLVSQKEEKAVEQRPVFAMSNGKKRILFQNRSNALENPGGDTVVMERYRRQLEKRGYEVFLDLQGTEDPSRFDLVHLFNFAIPQMVEGLGRRAEAARKPFIVTTLAEDIPTFVNQSLHATTALQEYVLMKGQDRTWLQSQLKAVHTVRPALRFQNDWSVQKAAALLTNGKGESDVLRRDYGALSNIREVPLGFDQSGAEDPELFAREYGVKNFILCVGRLEFRKNQLMLLRALEDSPLPVVLAAGGFSYSPEYEQAVRSFRRKGVTIITGRLSDQMLASAYAAAKVHVLPSWYELPGLVSLEAAWHGCNVVAAENGTARDYLGDFALYADPSHEGSIRNAVLAGYSMPVDPAFREHVAQYTWDRSVDSLIAVYEEFLGKQEPVRQQISPSKPAPGLPSCLTMRPPVASPTAVGVPEAPLIAPRAASVVVDESLLTDAEEAAGKGEYTRAHDLLRAAEARNPGVSRIFRSQGAVYLAESKPAEAKVCFERALALQKDDPRSLTGLGICETAAGNFTTAYQYVMRAVDQDPDHLVSLMQLVRLSYSLGKFHDLSRVLEGYVGRHPSDAEMRFCWAGSLFKMGQLEAADREAQKVLQVKPEHQGARELLGLLAEEREREELRRKQEAAREAPAMNLEPASSIGSTARQIAHPFAGTPEQTLLELEEEKRRKNFAQVLLGCDELLSQTGGDATFRERVTLLKAESLVLQGSIVEAERIYDQLLGSNPRSARAICGKGAISASRNDWSTAERFFRQANEFEPSYDVALAGLGLCSHWAKDTMNAWTWYMKALSYNPENVRALLGVIEIGYSLNRLEEVEKVIKEYLDYHPADLDIIYSLAGCYVAQERLDEAVEEIQKISLFRPDDEKLMELRRIVDEKRATTGAAALQ
jgi:glycosyltransferase involved in cell wall biosynthesis/tetratricopeptide (TPR) repeat protein